MYCVVVIREVGPCSDTNIIHIDSYCGPEQFVFEDNITIDEVHHRLEGRWGVGETEIHYCRFKEPISGFKGCLVFVSVANAYVIVSPAYVEFCVDMCVAQITYKISDEGKRILISNRDCVDFSVVLNRADFSILFANEEKG